MEKDNCVRRVGMDIIIKKLNENGFRHKHEVISMGKKNEKINAVKQYIENVAGIYTSYSYGGNINKQDVLGIIDTTVFGNGKKGIIFAENRLYYNYG